MRNILSLLSGFFLLLLSINGISQRPIDSLEQELAESNSGNRTTVLLQLAEAQLGSNPAKALKHASEAVTLSKKRKHRLDLAHSSLFSGAAHGLLGDQFLALLSLERAALIFKKEKAVEGQIAVLIQQGLAHQRLGNLLEADSIVQLGLALASKHDLPAFQMGLLIDQAQTTLMKGLANEAEGYLLEAEAFQSQANHKTLSARLELGLCRVNHALGNPARARAHLENALSLAEELSNLTIIGFCHLAYASLEKRTLHYYKAYEHAKKGHQIALQTANRRMAMMANWKSILLQQKIEKVDSVEVRYNEVQKQSLALGDQYNNTLQRQVIATKSIGSDKLDGALKAHIELYKLSQERHYFKFQASSYYAISKIHHILGEMEKTKEYAFLGLEVSKKIGSKNAIINGLRHLSNVHIPHREFDTSIQYIKEALQHSIDSDAKGLIILTKCELALLYYYTGKSNESKKLLDAVFEMKEELKLDLTLAKNAHQIAGQVYRLSHPYRSIDHFKKAIECNKEMQKFQNNITCYYFLSLIYESIENYQESLKYHRLLSDLKFSSIKAKRDNELNALQVQFETEQKEQQIAAIEKEKEVQSLTLANQEAKIVQQRLNFISLLFGALFFIGIGIFFFNRYQLRQKNEKLRLHTQQLELERKQEKTLQQLELSELRSDFFTNVSHEFRTPLTLILGPLEKLLGFPGARHKKDLERMHRNASRLLELVNETLDLSKLESGHLPLMPHTENLGDFVEKVAQSFVSLAETRQVVLKMEDASQNCTVDFDREKLEKVVTNLLSNAFSHTDPNDSISICVHPPDEKNIAISVTDTGQGIAAEHLPYVFDRFYQADTKGTKGSGVGLALSRQIVELHNGSIEVESTPGKGSTFSFSLPLRQESISKVSVSSTPTTEQTTDSNGQEHLLKESGKTVLVIEDHDEVRHYLTELLQPHYKVLSAQDGKEGIALAERHSPDLIVSDVMMPHKDGLELTVHLKQHLPTSHIPIILLTAKASNEHKIQGLLSGADDYLTKPFHSPELLQRCHNLISQREQLRKLFSSSHLVVPQKLARNTIDQNFLEKAIKIIEQHLDNPEFSVEEFCRELAYNRSGVHLKLKALTGKNTTQFIKSIKLKRAAELIRSTDESMSDIATLVGFRTRQTFNKAFKDQFQLTPSEFKNHEGPVPVIKEHQLAH